VSDENAFVPNTSQVPIHQILEHPNDYSSDDVRAARLKVLELGDQCTIRELKAFIAERGLYRFEVYSSYAAGPAYVAQDVNNKRAGFADIDTALRACYNHNPGVRSGEQMGTTGSIIQHKPGEVVTISAKDVGEIKL
jgi:hypothetical protein